MNAMTNRDEGREIYTDNVSGGVKLTAMEVQEENWPSTSISLPSIIHLVLSMPFPVFGRKGAAKDG